jgi:hypothetical protein
MRRAILTVVLGGVLLTGAACGSDSPPVTAGPTAAPSPSGPDYSVDTRRVCGEIQKVLDKNMESFGVELGKMIANKEAGVAAGARESKAAAQKKLRSFAAELVKTAEGAQDPRVRAAATQTADKLRADADNDAFYDGIEKASELDKALGPKVADWMGPVAGSCV